MENQAEIFSGTLPKKLEQTTVEHYQEKIGAVQNELDEKMGKRKYLLNRISINCDMLKLILQWAEVGLKSINNIKSPYTT